MTRLCHFCFMTRNCPIIYRVPFSSRAFSAKNPDLIGLYKTTQNRKPQKKSFKFKKMDPIKKFCDINDYSIFAKSTSGLETTVVVKGIKDKFSVCFDMGVACHENLGCDKVFIR